MSSDVLLPALLFALADTTPPAASACGADSMFVRAPVYVNVTVLNPADTKASSSLLTIAQSVATRIRQALGGSTDSVPRGDALVSDAKPGTSPSGFYEEQVDHIALTVVARRDGSIRWLRPRPASGGTPRRDVAALLDSALAETKAADEIFILPEQFSADSLPFFLHYEAPTVAVNGVLRPTADRPAALAAFTVRRPLQRPTAPVPGTVRVEFPAWLRYYAGTARMVYVVDTTGRTIPDTIHDDWPAGRPRLGGRQGDAYNDFVAAAREAITKGEYTPAEVAGCRVRQLVVQPFAWGDQPEPHP